MTVQREKESRTQGLRRRTVGAAAIVAVAAPVDRGTRPRSAAAHYARVMEECHL